MEDYSTGKLSSKIGFIIFGFQMFDSTVYHVVKTVFRSF